MLTVLRIQVCDQEGRLLSSKRVQGLTHIFAFSGEYFQTLDHSQLAIGVLAGQSRTQRTKQFLFGKRKIVAAWLWAVNGAAVSPQRRANRADTSPPGAFLLPQLLACARNQLLVLGGMSARALRGAIMRHRLPQQIFINRAEDLVGQLKGANLFPQQI